MRVAVITVWYNDPSIIRMLDSIPKDWDIYVIHSLFNGCDLQNDEDLVEKVKNYDNVVISEKNGEEWEVRQYSMDITDIYDVRIILDSDEFIINYDESTFEDEIHELFKGYYAINCIKNDKLTNYGRVFINEDVTYLKSHKYLNVGKPKDIFHSILIETNDDLRSTQIKNAIEEYQQELWKTQK
jgi:hypothetical protein